MNIDFEKVPTSNARKVSLHLMSTSEIDFISQNQYNPIKMQNKIIGMFYGCLIGDALGLPFEKRYSNKSKFNGIITPYTLFNRFTKITKTFSLGQSSDDGEMMIALLNSILEENGKYDKNTTLASYLDWANSGNPCLGKNTRALFHGVTTFRGYNRRFEKVFTSDEKKEASQSNGTLMRCLGLALIGLSDPENLRLAIEEDVSLSNPSTYTIKIECKFIRCLINALNGHDKDVITKNIKTEELDVTGKNKGWCYYAYMLALQALANTESFEEGLNWIIEQGGDTDTNGCVGGMLLGAYYGFEKMKEEEKTRKNIKIINKCDPTTSEVPRPKKYTPSHGLKVLKKLMALYEIE